ncbi:hypothetical protein LIER_41045 [Lithospermum erythrorhizon]|uniref:Uncharacterized protein n=1 Tax=Lithospermum erythrorhizon TaxID=34254 RepID=A0AAV3R985_LITER
MAGDEAGNGPPPPEDGPVITFEPGDEVSDLQNNLPHAPPSFSPSAQIAAGDIFLAYQAGGHGLTDLDVALPTSSQQQVLSNPISTQAPPPPKSILPQPPASLVDDSGPHPLIQPQPSDQGHGSTMDNHRPNNSLTSKTPNSSGLPTTAPRTPRTSLPSKILNFPASPRPSCSFDHLSSACSSDRAKGPPPATPARPAARPTVHGAASASARRTAPDPAQSQAR